MYASIDDDVLMKLCLKLSVYMMLYCEGYSQKCKTPVGNNFIHVVYKDTEKNKLCDALSLYRNIKPSRNRKRFDVND